MLDAPEFVCFDLPCLVVPHPGASGEALDRALRRLGLEPGAPQYERAVRISARWPGRSARAELGSALGSDVWADAAAAAYDDAFGAAVARRGAAVTDGAASSVAQLRALGARICVTTEFSAATREAITDVLDWTGLVAMMLSDDGTTGLSQRWAVPTALARAGVTPAAAVVVSGTATGLAAGREAGVGCLVGVPGDATSARLRDAGATEVLALPQLASRWSGARLVAV